MFEPQITRAWAIGSRPVAFQKLNMNNATRSACLAWSRTCYRPAYQS